jgi:hypothetical protein
MMKCEFCRRRRGYIRWFDSVCDCEMVSCRTCWTMQKNIFRSERMPIPNGRLLKYEAEVGTTEAFRQTNIPSGDICREDA